MKKRKLLLIIYWIFVISSLLVFGYGLRFDEVKLEMTITALVLWIISYLLNRMIRNEDKKKDQ